MKVIVAGTRTISDQALVFEVIDQSNWADQISEIVCGASEQDVADYLAGKRGGNPDIFGACWGRQHGREVKYFPPDWDDIATPGALVRHHPDGRPYNALAGPMRNEAMARYAGAGNGLILVWDGTSRGSKSMWYFARVYGLLRYQKIVVPQRVKRYG